MTPILNETAESFGALFDLAMGVSKAVAKNKANKIYSYSSLAKAASSLIAVFPVLVSRTVSYETSQKISKFIEQKACNLFTLALQQANISSAQSGIDYLKNFHQNLDIGGAGVDTVIRTMQTWVNGVSSAGELTSESVAGMWYNGSCDEDFDYLLEQEDTEVPARYVHNIMQLLKEMYNGKCIEIYDPDLNPRDFNMCSIDEAYNGTYKMSVSKYGYLNEARKKPRDRNKELEQFWHAIDNYNSSSRKSRGYNQLHQFLKSRGLNMNVQRVKDQIQYLKNHRAKYLAGQIDKNGVILDTRKMSIADMMDEQNEYRDWIDTEADLFLNSQIEDDDYQEVRKERARKDKQWENSQKDRQTKLDRETEDQDWTDKIRKRQETDWEEKDRLAKKAEAEHDEDRAKQLERDEINDKWQKQLRDEHDEDRKYEKKIRKDEQNARISSGRNVEILKDQDIKKMNDAVPSLLVVKFYQSTDATVATEFIIGVKSRMIPVTTTELLRRIMNDNKDGKKFLNFMRVITKDMKISEFLFNLSRMKEDVKSCRVKGAYGDTWNLLKNRADAAREQVKYGQKNDYSAITTVLISQADADELMVQENFDITDIRNALHFMDSYNLMAFGIVDDATESFKILFDDDTRMFENISYTMLERDTADKEYKKLISLMAAQR